MFGNVGWGEIALLAILGLVVFGPDRLPQVARDAVRTLRELRALARGAAADLKAELGPEMADLDLASLHPRRLVASVLDEDGHAVPEALPAPGPVVGALPGGDVPPYDDDAT